MVDTEALREDRYALRRADPRGFSQAYFREGEGGVPLLLVHGWPETARIWWRNLAPLAALGFDVIAPDLRGFGESEAGPDGFGDVASHSRDLYALLYEALGIERVIAVGGDLGCAVVQDLSLRHPGFVEQLVVFNGPLPQLEGMPAGRMPEGDALDYYFRQGNDAGGLAAELSTPEACQRYVGAFYTSRGWAASDAFTPAEVDFHVAPFAEPARLRETFKVYESALHAEHRVQRPYWMRNPTPTWVLFGAADGVMPPDWDERATQVFPDHRGPLRFAGAGHFLQWEDAPRLHHVLAQLLPEPVPAAAEQAFISLGSNLGAREQQLQSALASLRATPGVYDVVVSPIYETAPVGPGEQGPYLNAAARLRTTLDPEALLRRLLDIEDGLGRERSVRNAARVLDLDLLLQEGRQLETPSLTLPHPRMLERCFVLEPLLHLEPGLVPPGEQEDLRTFAARVRDPDAARRRD